VDRSGVTTNASTQLVAANAARKRITIEALSANTESAFINFGAPATTGGDSFEIMPGGYFDSLTGPVSPQQINMISASGGAKLVAKEF
jgi:hypothetical protein